MAITIHLDDPENVAGLPAAISQGLQPEAFFAPVGEAVVLLFQKHFLGLPTNKQEFPSSGFWAKSARATNFTVEDSGPMINVNQIGARQRYFGGTIRPVDKKYLTLPACAEAYGKKAGEFNNLHFGFAMNKYGNLAPALLTGAAISVSFGRRRKDGSSQVKIGARTDGGEVMFWLVKQVYQQADETVLPTDDEIIQAALDAANGFVGRFLDRGRN